MKAAFCPKCGTKIDFWDSGIATCTHPVTGKDGKVEPCYWRGQYPVYKDILELKQKDEPKR